MSDKSEIRTRVERLMRGAKNTRDLDRIFTWLRSRSYGHRTIRDVGDFTAHLEDRNKGVAWRGVQSISAMLAFHIPRVRAHGSPLDTLPGDLKLLTNAARAALDLVPPDEIKVAFGIGKTAARHTLDAALAKVDSFSGNTITASRPLTELEGKILKSCSDVLVAQPMFSDEELIDELSEVLKRNAIISANEVPAIRSQRGFVAVFTIEKMHLSKIKIGDDEIATLHASLDTETGLLEVIAAMPIPTVTTNGKMLFPIFKTSCDPREWCEGWNDDSPGRWTWHVPLETNQHGRLDLIR